MGLVYNDVAYIHDFQIRLEKPGSDPLRRKVEKFIVTVSSIVKSQVHLMT